jgi:hypothetical protein
MDSFMKRESSVPHRGQVMRSDESGMANSLSQARHLKCTIEVMKPLLVILLMAVSVQAQSLAEAAKKERERQAQLRPTRVITSIQASKIDQPQPQPPQPQPGAVDDEDEETTPAPRPPEERKVSQVPSPPDPVQIWNIQADQLRAKIRALQDQEMILLLQGNQVTNQVYAPVTDPVTQERALAQLSQVQLQLANVRRDLEEARRLLDALLLQGPPKK